MIFAGTQRGVYRSVDRGDNWERMNMTEGRVVWSIKFHPNDPKIMFLGTEGSEVYKSEDGGENWNYMSTISNPDAAMPLVKFSQRSSPASFRYNPLASAPT